MKVNPLYEHLNEQTVGSLLNSNVETDLSSISTILTSSPDLSPIPSPKFPNSRLPTSTSRQVHQKHPPPHPFLIAAALASHKQPNSPRSPISQPSLSYDRDLLSSSAPKSPATSILEFPITSTPPSTPYATTPFQSPFNSPIIKPQKSKINIPRSRFPEISPTNSSASENSDVGSMDDIAPTMGRQITEEFIDMHLSSSIDNYDSSNSKFVDTNSGSSATPMKVVTVLASDIIEHAVRLLILNNIHSLPVLHPQSQQCLGFIDTGDILSLVVNSIPQFMDEKKFPTVGGGSKKKKREYTVDSRAFGNNIHMEELDDILGHLDMFGRSISKEKVGVLIDASGTDPLFPTTLSTPVVRVLDLFSRGILRVPILASQDALAITQIFSASQMVKYLLQKIHLVPKLAGTEILELKNFDKELVVTTVIKDSVVQALKKLYNNSVHALAIVDTNDRLCGNFSQMDVKGLYTDTIPSLIDPLSSYLARSSPMSLSPVSCDRRTTFSTVVASLVTHKVSQVWVVDDGEKPIGSFSITDACRAVCSFKE